MLWLYLHFPMLQLDTLYLQQPDQPIVIMDARQHRIVQANTIAMQQGIRLGMGLAGAATLSPNMQVCAYDSTLEKQALQDLAQWLYLVTSDIVLFPPKGLLLKASTMLSLYQNLDNYWHIVQQQLDARAPHYQYASGISPLSAKLLAEQGWNTITSDPACIQAAIRQQPLTATELADKQVTHLLRVGIRHIDDLLHLPMQELARRFDIDLVNYVGRLLGQFKHPCTYFQPPESFRTDVELLYELDNILWLKKPLTRLFQQMAEFLRLRNQVAFDVELILWQKNDQMDVLDKEKKRSIVIQAAQGEDQATTWLSLTELQLESVTLIGPVYRLSLTVKRSGFIQANTSDFWHGVTGSMASLELISLLQAKLGKDKIHKLSLTDDPRPEKSTRLIDAIEQGLPSCRRPQLRPSMLLPAPIPLSEQVTLIEGPERIMTGWWDGQPVTRDYFIARSTTGRWLWVFRNIEQSWFLHGYFS